MRFLSAVAGIVVLVASTPALSQNQTLPPLNADYDSQLGGAYPPAPGVGILSRDRTEPPAASLYNICYVNAFQTQPGHVEWWLSNHPTLLLRKDGALIEDENWPDEFLLDFSSAQKQAALMAVVGAWIDRCAADGYQAIEADNVDAWLRSDGLLTRQNAIDYAYLLGRRAHDNDLAFAQKNAVELGVEGPYLGYDFAIVESCAQYDECDDYRRIYGDYVLQVEYERAVFLEACERRGETDVIVLRDRLLLPSDAPGHVYEAC